MSLSLSSLLNPTSESEERPRQNLEDAHDAAARTDSGLERVAHAGVISQSTDWPAESYSASTIDNRQSNSSHGDHGIQLPPPDSTRKMSSPTLEQYRIASRSPEQRRASLVSPLQPGVTLPLQNIATDHTAHQPPMEERNTADNVLPHIKEEPVNTPTSSSPIDHRRLDFDQQTSKSVATLKQEHSHRQSPLRESSVPVPTTELPQTPQPSSIPKKRPAPTKTKKGTATTTKNQPAAKRRRVEPKGDSASRPPKANAKIGGAKGTPVEASPAPSARTDSDDGQNEYDEDEDDEDEDMDRENDGDVYCICRKPDSGTFMIGCDGTCDDWFHGKCVGIEERDKNLIDKYMCPNCTEAAIGQTTWKRICRRSGCRQPARVGNARRGHPGSKYCSDECGTLFFRDRLSGTRGRDGLKSRNSRRKSIHLPNDDNADEDLGARGGSLAASEVKSLLNAAKTADDFRKLGDGTLSPPATPPETKHEPNGPITTTDLATVDSTADLESTALQSISAQKQSARHRHTLLKDRLKFVNLAKAAAVRVAAEREVKAKDYCGYDSRLEWSEAEFEAWRSGPEGRKMMGDETGEDMQGLVNGKGADDTDSGNMEGEICDRKKCARHVEWAKLTVDDLRMEMNDNGDRMRALDREEKVVRERAAFRAKGGLLDGEGTVEVHDFTKEDVNMSNGVLEQEGGDEQPEATPEVVQTSEGDGVAAAVAI